MADALALVPVPVPVQRRHCNLCGLRLPITEFYARSGRCKNCRRFISKVRRLARVQGVMPWAQRLNYEVQLYLDLQAAWAEFDAACEEMGVKGTFDLVRHSMGLAQRYPGGDPDPAGSDSESSASESSASESSSSSSLTLRVTRRRIQ